MAGTKYFFAGLGGGAGDTPSPLAAGPKAIAVLIGAKLEVSASGYADADRVRDEILMMHREGELNRPLVLGGHSNGGYAVLKIATDLDDAGIAVDYMPIVELTAMPSPAVPGNVKAIDHFEAVFSPVNALNKLKLSSSFIAGGGKFSHFTIPTTHIALASSKKVQDRISYMVAKLEGEPMPKETEMPAALNELHSDLARWLDPANETQAMSRFYGAFFSSVRGAIFKPLSQEQVNGMKAMLWAWYRFYAEEPASCLAAIMANAVRETGGRMEPVRETFATSDDQAVARLEAAWKRGDLQRYGVKSPYWRHDGHGFPFGRGIMQITHRDKYISGAKMLKSRFSLDVDLAGNYGLALDPVVSVLLAVGGCMEGIFRNSAMPDYVNGGEFDFYNSRDVVNGDKAKVGREIAADGKRFLEALEAGKSVGSLVAELSPPVDLPTVGDADPGVMVTDEKLDALTDAEIVELGNRVADLHRQVFAAISRRVEIRGSLPSGTVAGATLTAKGKSKMNEKLQGLVRHILTTAGGVAVGKGWLDEQTATALIGAGMAIIGFVWSWIAPEKS